MKLIIYKVIKLLRKLNSKQQCYCDIKGENILEDSNGRFLLGDFGFSSEMRKLKVNESRSSIFYSLGMLLLELASGRRDLNVIKIERNKNYSDELYLFIDRLLFSKEIDFDSVTKENWMKIYYDPTKSKYSSNSSIFFRKNRFSKYW